MPQILLQNATAILSQNATVYRMGRLLQIATVQYAKSNVKYMKDYDKNMILSVILGCK